MTDLAERRCRSCEGDVPALDAAQAAVYLAQVPGWEVQGHELVRTFTFKNYYRTVAFINAAAWIAHNEDHHPEIAFGYKTCTIRYHTHSIHALTENDFICAAKINRLVME
jgi:4a-hydroxytetrahydrobiopterin dehydratase